MYNSVKKKKDNVRLQLKNKKTNVAVRKAAKSLGRIAIEGGCEKTKETTDVSSKSNEKELESSPAQLDILSVKENNGQIVIEYRARSTSAPSIAGTDAMHTHEAVQEELTKIKVENQIEFGEYSISVQSISATYKDAERHNYQTFEDEVDIEMDKEMEFCDLSSTAQSIPATDDKEHSNKTIQGMSAQINVDTIDIGEPSSSVQSISTTTDELASNRKDEDELKKIENGMELCDEVEKDACNAPKTATSDKPYVSKKNKRQSALKTAIADKPDIVKKNKRQSAPKTAIADKCKQVSKSNKNKSEFICDICSKKYSSKRCLVTHQRRHGKPNFHCTVCGVARFRQCDIDVHMRQHDPNPKYFTCDLCPSKLSSAENLARHRKRHGKPKFRCSVCGVAKFLQFELDQHMRTHDPIYFKCGICPKKFLSKKHLKKHRLRHDKSSFSCNVCDVTKFTRRDFKIHMKVHNTKRD